MIVIDFFSMLALDPYRGPKLLWSIYLLWLSFLISTMTSVKSVFLPQTMTSEKTKILVCLVVQTFLLEKILRLLMEALGKRFNFI